MKSGKNNTNPIKSWEKRFNKFYEHWITNYLFADDAFDLDLRAEVAKTEFKELIREEITKAELRGYKAGKLVFKKK